MAKEFYSHTTNNLRGLCNEPTDDDFLSYVRLNWPTIKSCLELEAEEGTLVWGCVYKQEPQKTNVINILSNGFPPIVLGIKRMKIKKKNSISQHSGKLQ